MNTKTAIITLVLAVSGTLVTLNFTGENIPTVGEVAKITYAPDSTMRYTVGSFTYKINNIDELEAFTVVDPGDNDNTLFAREIIKSLLRTKTAEQVISDLEGGIPIQDINIQ